MPGAPVLDDSCMAAHGQLEKKSLASLVREPVVRHAALQCFLKGEVRASLHANPRQQGRQTLGRPVLHRLSRLVLYGAPSVGLQAAL